MASKRVWVAAAAGAVLLGVVVLQAVNSSRVRSAVCGAGQQACQPGAGLLGLAVEHALPGATLRLHGSTALLRHACGGQWTLGFGARLDLDALALGDSVALAGGCADLGATRSTATLAGVRLRQGTCMLALDPVQATWHEDMSLQATARVLPEAAKACAAALGERATTLGLGAPETWQLTLNARYALPHGAALPAAGPAASGAAPSAGLLRHAVSTLAMSHDIAFTAGASRVALGLASRPAAAGSGASPELTLTAGVAGPLAEQLPPDARLLLAQQAPLQLRWNLDHESVTVFVQGQPVKRVAAAPRPAGPVDLSAECTKNATAPLHFVEAGERGEAVAPSQLQAVQASVEAAQARAGTLVSVFVHGWQHSAAKGDSYVCDFAALLRAVDTMERNAARAAGRPAREVLGVYVGWPGHLYPTELANLTTFWNRLDMADRLGVPGGALRTLMQTLGERVTQPARDPRPDRRSGLVVTGHSMGGRAVFQAVRHAFEPGGAGSSAAKAPVPDLLLLVNPAFSAEQFRAAHTRRMACQAPALPMLLFSSEADAVTRQVYPAGQVASFDEARQRKVPFVEHAYTAANFEAFVTHRLTFELLSGPPPEAIGEQNILRGFERVPAGSNELYLDNPVTVYRQPARGRPTAADAWYRMRVVPEGQAQSPPCAQDRSRVMKVDARILPDHGTIFSPAFMEFVIRSFNHGTAAGPR